MLTAQLTEVLRHIPRHLAGNNDIQALNYFNPDIIL